MTKKFFALVLFVVTVASMLSIGYAYDMNDILTQAPDYYTEEYQAGLRETLDAVDAHIENKMLARSGSQKFLTVPLVQQQNDFYCGPAAALMVIKTWNKNSSMTQSVLGGEDYCNTTKEKGTIVAYLTSALNKVMGSGMYKYVHTSTKTFSSSLIYSVDKGYPVVCHVNTSKLPAYNGAYFGHYVVATGYSYGFTGQTNENKVRYNDPHYDKKYYGTFTIDWMKMTEAINAKDGYYIMKS